MKREKHSERHTFAVDHFVAENYKLFPPPPTFQHQSANLLPSRGGICCPCKVTPEISLGVDTLICRDGLKLMDLCGTPFERFE